MTGKVYVGMAQLSVVKRPFKIETQALGSCVGVVLYDISSGIGGIAHAMLPDVNEAKESSRSNPAKFVNTAIKELVDKMVAAGARRLRIEAKLAGGANMFPEVSRGTNPHIGERNVEMARKVLGELKVPIVAEETGGFFGRTIILDTETGKLNVKTITQGEKEI